MVFLILTDSTGDEGMAPQVAAALIAGAIALLGVVASVLSARWTLASAREKLRAETDALRQSLLKEVLGRRMEAYAALWEVLTAYGLNWRLEGKETDSAWATEYLRRLNTCNARHGVFFSQAVYEQFYKYRKCLIEIEHRARSGVGVTGEDHKALADIAVGVNGRPGLGTVLKDDLGSYIEPVTRASARLIGV